MVSKISTKKLTHYAGSLSEYEYKGLLTIKGTVKTGKALGDGIEHREFYPDASVTGADSEDTLSAGGKG